MKKILFLLLLGSFISLSLGAQKPLRKPQKPTQSSNAGKDKKDSARRPSKPSSGTLSKQPAKSNTAVTPKKQQAQRLVEPAQSAPSTTEPQDVLTVTGRINGHEYVDLGLSVRWATCNVGANSPADYGNYYAWGETSPIIVGNSVTFGKNMGDISGDYRYDAARANWGGSWRLPTKSEIEELVSKCKTKWITYNGRKGRLVTGPNGKSIFLPAAAWIPGSSQCDVDEGYYWSSIHDDSSDWAAYALYVGGNDFCLLYGSNCGKGYTVRPVSE